MARTVLIAAGLEPDTLVFRDARQPRWNRGLNDVTAILCDAYTATIPNLPARPHIIVYPFLADAARTELSRYSKPPALL
jgi:GntR family transcriptional regulator